MPGDDRTQIRTDRRTEGASRRGQLSITLIEAIVGVVFVFGVAVTFGIGVPAAGADTAQLDRYASDTVTVLENEPPRHVGETRLTELTRSASGFDRERDALERRVGLILPDNVFYRVEVSGPDGPYGAVGQQRPRGVPVGYAAVTTRHGEVELWVWYG
ncbi:putative pilin/flagellin [Halalkaliarchaeum sp. AArc-CO]|uniref:DUF7262 family protein n=1 Tax=unclassified Halalkaliarchaeum TaxID=2678344 RepID=UPI00217D74A4|nr:MULTISPECIES: hypothetical protein [unclassified Halalkaliarchaeum]MDR5673452.1 hypothetical protein [Halalkaliarchaeum sp. AArc-GB]UWG49872.1 putative pilin/flagellin [Halalkaliarchaeum sp. AArc-CO]